MTGPSLHHKKTAKRTKPLLRHKKTGKRRKPSRRHKNTRKRTKPSRRHKNTRKRTRKLAKATKPLLRHKKIGKKTKRSLRHKKTGKRTKCSLCFKNIRKIIRKLAKAMKRSLKTLPDSASLPPRRLPRELEYMIVKAALPKRIIEVRWEQPHWREETRLTVSVPELGADLLCVCRAWRDEVVKSGVFLDFDRDVFFRPSSDVLFFCAEAAFFFLETPILPKTLDFRVNGRDELIRREVDPGAWAAIEDVGISPDTEECFSRFTTNICEGGVEYALLMRFPEMKWFTEIKYVPAAREADYCVRAARRRQLPGAAAGAAT